MAVRSLEFVRTQILLRGWALLVGLKIALSYKLYWNVGGSDGVDLAPFTKIEPSGLELFTTYLGHLPVIREGKWCNGGLPQLANTSAHLSKVRSDIEARNVSMDYLVVDYEDWWGVWNDTSDTYRNASVKLAAVQHPELPPSAVLAAAVHDYNTASQAFLVATLQTAAASCNCRAGMYSYPARVYWNGYCSPDGDRLRNVSDLMAPIFDASGALFPSIYQFYPTAPREQVQQYVDCNVKEAVRVAKGKPVLPYGWYLYHDTAGGFLSSTHASLEFDEASHIEGVSGGVIWGDAGGNTTRVQELQAWLSRNAAIFTGSGAAPTRRSTTQARQPPHHHHHHHHHELSQAAVEELVAAARANDSTFPPPFEWCSL